VPGTIAGEAVVGACLASRSAVILEETGGTARGVAKIVSVQEVSSSTSRAVAHGLAPLAACGTARRNRGEILEVAVLRNASEDPGSESSLLSGCIAGKAGLAGVT
jgi:hypothetical protein